MSPVAALIASLSTSGGSKLAGNGCACCKSNSCVPTPPMPEIVQSHVLRSAELVTDSLKYTVKGTSGIPVRASVWSTTTV